MQWIYGKHTLSLTHTQAYVHKKIVMPWALERMQCVYQSKLKQVYNFVYSHTLAHTET